MPQLSIIDACAIERDFAYLAQMIDDYSFDAEFSRMTFYDAQSSTPWVAHDLDWKTVSVCVWSVSQYGPRVYVALSTEGDIEILGPGGQPQIVEHIPGAGLNRPWSQKKGLMVRVRQIGTMLYACGSGYSVYNRDQDGWKEMPSSLDMHASAADSRFFYDVNGYDQKSLCAVGPNGSSRSRVASFDGTQWRDVDDDIPGTLTVVALSTRGGYYIGGSRGLLLYGELGSKFEVAGVSTTNRGNTLGMVEYKGILYIACNDGLCSIASLGRTITPVETGLLPKLSDVGRLSVAGDVLWSFGAKDIAFFDGASWTRVHDPENPRIGR